MDAIDVGWLSILPPVIAIVLALITKEVISSLIVGIFSGTLIYAFSTGGGIVKATDVTLTLMGEKLGDNTSIILFLGFLGALVAVITMAGGSRAYGEWAGNKIKTKKGAQLGTSLLGTLIFIDDYFNCLTIGTVMRPVIDKHHISRAKLAYIIDATAAPICIIAPISSWAASVISQMNGLEVNGQALNGMETFMATIPYNLYAILTLIMVVVLCVTNIEFGPMAKFEEEARNNKGNLSVGMDQEGGDEFARMKISSKGSVFDLIIPIAALIIFAILSMLYIGGYFEGGMTLAEGFGNTDAGIALAIAGFGALVVAFILFVPRQILDFKEFMEGITIGVKSMVGAFIILTLAWTISGVCRDLLGTGEFVGELVRQSHMPAALIPAIVFLVAGALAFAMGTSWGTFGILIPIVTMVCGSVAPELVTAALAATLAGAVFGDHCSPISDTTILSSTGAGCKHIDHVSSQIPYTLVVAACCFVGYLIAGFTANVWLTLGSSIALLGIILAILSRRNKK
ncbi:Na+/H+ antiporter NhaC family protein [Cellulosilyticum lentocellum]|uniref:Na+/H+ antiporter NhaC-like protein n=1 Tax=Cellulosilyticum lentocellum (strain ATCC 49066 / DSM 5427 / NCIMB 11756 / RHM5) TaxID=642492 RepID=F2JPM9_CELLD|nr:Na+/H+ antiporter NhaC family protein [Cellulosilyticum lentocellum]ADZ83689.1 Na+/H+ antiporter NhaC-like protein [Cellulosilyticum lentocellum DSM 5427]